MNSDTKKSYISLAKHFYATRLRGAPKDELHIIGALLRAAPDYRPDYFRRMRNALAFDQWQRGNHRAAQEINRSLNPVTVLRLPRKKKQPRSRRLTDEHFEAWIRLLTEQGKLVEVGALILIYLTGARPCELAEILINGDLIFIPGAKVSHKGLRGANRTLQADQDICNVVKNALGAFKSQSRSLDSVRVAIHEAARELFGSRKVPSMYTLRHQFGANLKASGFSRIEMAYLMGHQATDSISRYGDKRFGRAGAMKVRPSADADLSKVRDTQPERKRAVAQTINKKRGLQSKSGRGDS
jgi:integrase